MARFCACGCRTSLAGMRSDARWATDACRKRGPAAASPEKARKRNGSRPSDFRMSYPKAVRAMAAYLAESQPSNPAPVQTAEVVLREALPVRQRERLEERA